MNIEQEIERLLGEMTLEEKVSLCHANSKFTVAGIERLGIDELTMSDGPHGVREEIARHEWKPLGRDDDFGTYLPTEIALAATWNTELAGEFGKTLGSEARHRGKDIILAPGVNIIRNPLCGRNFEYMSEDPYLTAEMAVPLVQGIQSEDTAACVKHYALNNQEFDRMRVNVEVDDRTLREIYLKAFETVVKRGGALAVMGAYNRYKNQHCCHNKYLVNDILKGEWGFDGVFLTDWDGAHDTDEAIENGLDIEMGTKKDTYDEYYLADAFLERARTSERVRGLLDDKVRRILRLMLKINKLSSVRKLGEYNTKGHQQTAYNVAAEAMVLLKNDALPLKNTKGKRIAVVGENAIRRHARGGNSSGVKALYEVTLLEGLQNACPGADIEYLEAPGSTRKPIPMDCLEIIDKSAGCRAFRQEIFNTDGNRIKQDFCDTPAIKDGTADFYRYEANVRIPEDGRYTFTLTAKRAARLKINGEIKCMADGGDDVLSRDVTINAKKDETYNILLEYWNKTGKAQLEFGWKTPGDADSQEDAQFFEKLRKADYVIYCGGINHDSDTEGFDRKNMSMGDGQNRLIGKILSVRPDSVIVMTAGSPIEMPWIEKAKTVLLTWYAGMEGGNAFGDIITGKLSPSGKLPVTLPYKLEDTPMCRYGEYKAENCRLNEGMYVGYRGFEKDGIKPMFCFGHGLSYCEFTYENIDMSVSDSSVDIELSVTNNGSMTASETVQIYAGIKDGTAEHPKKELKGFKKVCLEPGEAKRVHITVNREEFMYFDADAGIWRAEHGTLTVYVGASIEDIRLTAGGVL